jgi:nucleotide-binding universal stress UspA family protein
MEGTMYERILIALQGRETDGTVVANTKSLAAQIKAKVTLLHVIAVADDGGEGLGRQMQTEIGSNGWRRKNQAEADLSQLERCLSLEGLRVETALVVSTRSEADEIVHYAAEHGYDLIAMAADEQPWYRRLLGGSPAGGVLRKATVPTLFVGDCARRAPETRTAPEVNQLMAILGSADL